MKLGSNANQFKYSTSLRELSLHHTNILTELHCEKIHKIGKNLILSATTNVVTTLLGKSEANSL
jgi:hypothetical protein